MKIEIVKYNAGNIRSVSCALERIGISAEVSDDPEVLAAADKVMFVPAHPRLLLVEGCPEARNVWTYIIDLEAKTARQFPSTEGILSFSASGDTLVLGAYRYHEEGGRYSVARTYTLEGQLVREDVLDD